MDRIILAVVGGSRAYGINGPGSDVDLRIVIMPHRAKLNSLFEVDYSSRGEYIYSSIGHNNDVAAAMADELCQQIGVQEGTKVDFEIYDVRKFLRLATFGNTQTLEMMHAPVDCNIKTNLWFKSARKLFLSMRVVKALQGFAVSSFKDYTKSGSLKPATHAVRLLLMARNLLQRGEFTVRLTGLDLAIVSDVKAGKYTLTELSAMFKQFDNDVNTLCATNKTLPLAAPLDIIDSEYQRLVEIAHE